MNNVRDTFGKRLTELRESRGLTIVKAANEIGITRQSLSRYETGTIMPDIEVLCMLANFYDVSADYLVGMSDCYSRNTSVSAMCDYTGFSENMIEFFNLLFRVSQGLPGFEEYTLTNILEDLIRGVDVSSFRKFAELKRKSEILVEKDMLFYSFDVQGSLYRYLLQRGIDVTKMNIPKLQSMLDEIVQSKIKQISFSPRVAEVIKRENMSAEELCDSYSKDCKLARYDLTTLWEDMLGQYDKIYEFEKMEEFDFLEYIGFTKEELKDIRKKAKEEIEHVQHPQTNK